MKTSYTFDELDISNPFELNREDYHDIYVALKEDNDKNEIAFLQQLVSDVLDEEVSVQVKTDKKPDKNETGLHRKYAGSDEHHLSSKVDLDIVDATSAPFSNNYSDFSTLATAPTSRYVSAVCVCA